MTLKQIVATVGNDGRGRCHCRSLLGGVINAFIWTYR